MHLSQRLPLGFVCFMVACISFEHFKFDIAGDVSKHLPKKGLGHEIPIQALKRWTMKAQKLFFKNVRNRLGSGNCPQSRFSTQDD